MDNMRASTPMSKDDCQLKIALTCQCKRIVAESAKLCMLEMFITWKWNYGSAGSPLVHVFFWLICSRMYEADFGAKIFLASRCTSQMIHELVLQIGGVIQGF